MKTVNYSQFSPDSLISPLWLNELLKAVIILLSVTFVFLISMLFFMRKAALFVVILEVVFLLLIHVYLFYSIYSNYFKQTRIYNDGRLVMPRKTVKIRDISRIEIYMEAYIVGKLIRVDLMVAQELYSVSIKDVESFISELRKQNKYFVLVDNRKVN